MIRSDTTAIAMIQAEAREMDAALKEIIKKIGG